MLVYYMSTKGRPHKIYSEEQKLEINKAYKKSGNAKEKCRLLCIKLRVKKAMPSLKIAEISGLSQCFVEQLISTYNRFGIAEIKAKKQEGHNRNMTPEQEKEFLNPFLEKALLEQILIVNDIISDYEKVLDE